MTIFQKEMLEQNGLYAEEYGEQTYMEQEEEWEREGLLDPAWEKQQKKVSESSFVMLHKEMNSHQRDHARRFDPKTKCCVLMDPTNSI